MNQFTKLIQKLKQRDKERVGRAITKWGAIEKQRENYNNFFLRPIIDQQQQDREEM